MANGWARDGAVQDQIEDSIEDALAEALVSEPALLRHVHALTLEAQVTLRLHATGNIDPVLSPLLQDLIAAKDDVVAGVAMATLAAQARFVQHYRRMELPLGELPAELFHRALLLFRSHADCDDAAAAEHALRQSYEERHGRLGLLSRLVMRMGLDASHALDAGHAGVAIFATALAMAQSPPFGAEAMSSSAARSSLSISKPSGSAISGWN